MDLLDEIRLLVGENGLLVAEDVRARPNLSWGLGSCPARAIVRPRTTTELAQVMGLCHQYKQPMVPWGGQSGLVNGFTCEPDDIAISLELMSTIEQIDRKSGTMIVQAGALVQQVQEAASQAGSMFAVDFGARGSAQIGGAIATNAGGNSVVRYGMMREQVLGLEAVLADGTVISSMNEMLKNNAGYDLKQLFIGSEGTLGIVSRAVLRLRPQPKAVQTAFLGVNGFDELTGLLQRVLAELEGKLSAFEVLWQSYYRLLQAESAAHRELLSRDHAFYVLLEQEGADQVRGKEHFVEVLSCLIEEGAVADALLVESDAQRTELWALRDDIDTLVRILDPAMIFDVSMPIRHMERYVDRVELRLRQEVPEARNITFGHLGDGNIHLAIGPCRNRSAIEAIVYDELIPVHGSISAEHGIGLDKREFLPRSKTPAELALMKTIKRALDPEGLLNRGKVFS